MFMHDEIEEKLKLLKTFFVITIKNHFVILRNIKTSLKQKQWKLKY